MDRVVERRELDALLLQSVHDEVRFELARVRYGDLEPSLGARQAVVLAVVPSGVRWTAPVVVRVVVQRRSSDVVAGVAGLPAARIVAASKLAAVSLVIPLIVAWIIAPIVTLVIPLVVLLGIAAAQPTLVEARTTIVWVEITVVVVSSSKSLVEVTVCSILLVIDMEE